ncbi:hypothetical protein Tco_1337627 [Tanacetum coccineum]
MAPTIPPSLDYTPASPDYSPASDSDSDPSEDPSSDHIPPLPAISPFLSSDDDITDSDTPDTTPSPTHVMILSPGQPIPHGRPYRYHLNGLASSDFHSDASSDSSSRHSLSDHSSPDLPSTSAGLSCKRRRSPTTSVPALSPVSGVVSPVRADLIPSPKRVKDSGYLADVEVDPKEISLRDDAIVRVNALRDRGIDARVVVEAVDRDEIETGVRGPVEVRVKRVTHPVIPEDIPEPAQEGALEVTYETLGDLVQRFHDHTQAIPVYRIQAIEGVQREQGHRIVGVESAVIALTERITELERDNKRLRGTVSVESQRVDRLQHGMSRVQRELRQMRRLRFYDRVRVGRLEAKMPNTQSEASMTREEVEELVNRRVAEEMEARKAAIDLEPMNEDGDELEGENGGNGNGGNRGNGNGGNENGGNGENKNGNRNGNHGMNYRGFMPVAQECTFQDFLKWNLRIGSQTTKDLILVLGKEHDSSSKRSSVLFLCINLIISRGVLCLIVVCSLINEKLCSMLKDVLKRKPNVVVEYFYGLSNDLSPNSSIANFSDLAIYKIGGGPQAPASALPIGAHLLLLLRLPRSRIDNDDK